MSCNCDAVADGGAKHVTQIATWMLQSTTTTQERAPAPFMSGNYDRTVRDSKRCAFWHRRGDALCAEISIAKSGDGVFGRMDSTAKRQLVRRCADLMGRQQLAARLRISPELLDAWISGDVTMPDGQLLPLATTLNQLAKQKQTGSA